MLIAAVCKCAIISLPLGEKNHPIAKMIRKLRKPLSAADDKNVICQDVLVMLISLSLSLCCYLMVLEHKNRKEKQWEIDVSFVKAVKRTQCQHAHVAIAGYALTIFVFKL